MSQALKKNDQLYLLENVFWKREQFLNKQITLHTIQCQKISDKAVHHLKGNGFVLVGEAKSEVTTYGGKKAVESTEVQEMRVDNLKVTEASIISHTKNGETSRVLINESHPEGLKLDKLEAGEEQTESEKILSIVDLVGHKKKKTEVDGRKISAKEVAASRDFKKVEHEQFVFRQEIARAKNSFFFKVKDSPALFKLGNSYYEDFKAGCKHFGFIHAGSAEIQKRSILGVASFFHYHENLKILILTNSMYNTFFAQFKQEQFHICTSISAYPEFKYSLYYNEGLNFMELNELLVRSHEHEVKGLEFLFQKLVGDYDVVIYDLPSLTENKNHDAIYFSQLQTIQNVSFVLNMKSDTFAEVDDLRKYFGNYKIKIKGIVTGQEG